MSNSSEPEHHRGGAADSAVVIRAEGEVRVVIETADAARIRVWAAAPSPDAARAHSATDSEEGVGQRLLEALGL